MAEFHRMSKSELFAHFAERFGIKRAEAGEFSMKKSTWWASRHRSA